MRAIKYFLVSLLVVSIVKRTRAQDSTAPLTQSAQIAATPAEKIRVTKGSKTIGYYLPEEKMVQTKNGETLFVDVIEKKQGNYKKTGYDAETLAVTTPNGTQILKNIGTVYHTRSSRKGTLYGAPFIKSIIHTT
ncbi:MAG: hypothetical protein NTZ68_04090 [Candidatus Dependentiae bacterium]|nr:hypothetical protein [Candidatus Dependentiae bacterium]